MAFTAKILSWRFRHLNIVDEGLRLVVGGGGSRAPQDPPPSYAPESWREQARTWWASYFYSKTACL